MIFNAIVMYGIAGKDKCGKCKMDCEDVEPAKTKEDYNNEFNRLSRNRACEPCERRKFAEAGVKEKMREIKSLIERLDIEKRVEFDTTHATNLVKLQGWLPEQREEFMEKLEVSR